MFLIHFCWWNTENLYTREVIQASWVCVCVVMCMYTLVLLHIFFIQTVCGIHSIYQQLNN